MREVITCLVVDDEPPMVHRLQRMFDRWEERGLPYKLVGTAYSGDEGLEKAAVLKPDLVLTDVVMPGKNGLEMIRELRETYPRMEFIILSAYSDFAYAKQAIAIGVFEYLVKVPLKEGEVLAALEKARDNLLAWAEKDRKLQSLSGSVKVDAHRMRKQLLEELVRRELGAAAMERRSPEYAPGFRPGPFACFAVRLDDYASFCEEYSPADRNSLRFGLLNIMEEVLGGAGGSFVCEMSPGTLIGFSVIEAAGEHVFDRKGLELAEELLANVKTYLRLSVSIGVSRRHRGWEQAADAYREACAAVDDAFYFSFGMVVTPNRRLAYVEADARGMYERFEAALDSVSQASARDELTSLLKLLHTYRIAPDKLLPYIGRWLLRLRHKLNPAGSGKEQEEALSLQPETCAHLHQLTDRLRMEWERILAKAEPVYVRPDMAKAILYVEEHLRQTVSLGGLADHIHLNPSYVSELFKKELGINFTDYVARRRIERAIELMRKRPYSYLELAEAVGIQNEKYFCTLFKKITGTSPQKYDIGGRRNQH
jgi:two-component system response regulator YesN